MPRRKKNDFWIMVISNGGGMHSPLHVFGKTTNAYMCDEEAVVDNGKVTRIPLNEVMLMPMYEEHLILEDVNINNLPDLIPIDRRWYAATVENISALSAALAKTRPDERVLQEKIRTQFAEQLAKQRAVLLAEAKRIMQPRSTNE